MEKLEDFDMDGWDDDDEIDESQTQQPVVLSKEPSFQITGMD